MQRLLVVVMVMGCSASSPRNGSPDPVQPTGDTSTAAGAGGPGSASVAATGSGQTPTGPAPAPPVPTPRFEAPPPKDAVVDISTGLYNCMVRKSGHVDCLGTALSPQRYQLARIPEIADARSVVVANVDTCFLRSKGVSCRNLSHTDHARKDIPNTADIERLALGTPDCGITKQGAVKCWGNTMVADPKVTGARSVISHGYTTCAVLETGKVTCGNQGAWSQVAGLDNVAALAMGADWDYREGERSGARTDTCALHKDGTFRCFQLEGSKIVKRAPERKAAGGTHRIVTIPRDATKQIRGATAIAMAYDSTSIAFLVGGKVMLLEQAFDDDAVPTIRTLPDLADAVTITSSCALREQGSVVCWGTNHNGLAGYPSTLGEHVRLTTVVGVAQLEAISTSSRFTYAIDASGAAYLWGNDVTVPAKVAGVSGVVAIGPARSDGNCLLRRDGTVSCLDRDGKHPKDAGLRDVTQLVGSLALLRDGTALRIRSDTPPIKVAGIADAVELSGGVWTTCMRDRAGAVRCGKLECKATTCTFDKPEPVGVTDVVELAGYNDTTCARKQTGAIVCWGVNNHRIVSERPELTHGRDAVPPTDIGITDAVSIALADKYACAIRRGGKLTCWGDPIGPDGKSRSMTKDTAIDVIGSGVVAASLSADHACAILQDRRATCWGKHDHGELGDGSVLELPGPVAIPNL